MLEVRHIVHQYANEPVLQDIELTVAQGEILCLLGASGCGKTTLLRVIAGLETDYTGAIHWAGQAVDHTPPHQRDFGLMFQDYALFPHLTVAQNIAFGLRMQGMGSIAQQRRTVEMLDLVGLAGFENRRVGELSGGEKQRVALARSLAPQPRLLMLDEPLGSLDALLRENLALELREIIKKIGLTAVYVTHDRQEAYAIADRIAVMQQGKIEQIGTPETLYQTPRSRFVAQFLGLNNILPVERSTPTEVLTPLGTFPVADAPRYLLLHPVGLHLSATGQLKGIVKERVFQGESYRLTVTTAANIALTFPTASTAPVPPLGAHVTISVMPQAVIGLFA